MNEIRTVELTHSVFLLSLPFIFTVVVTKEVLGYTKALSVKLQGRYVDVVLAHTEIELVKSTLKNLRDTVQDFHSRTYTKALNVASSIQVEESRPRTTGRQEHRSNVPAVSSSEYYPLLPHYWITSSLRWTTGFQNIYQTTYMR